MWLISGEFSLYDHVLDHSAQFNVIPSRYAGQGLSDLDVYFAMARGRQVDGVDVAASEMKKWYVVWKLSRCSFNCFDPRFDSNYHYVVPELSDAVSFKLNFNKAVDEYKEAKAAGIETRPVVLGPISYLVLGKASRDAPTGFETLSLLPKLLPVYVQLLSELKQAGAEWVQIDEPILVLDNAITFQSQFADAYGQLEKVAPKIMLTTYFGRLENNMSFVVKLPVSGLHVDLAREPGQFASVVAAVKSTNLILSLGFVNGRNIWKTDISAAIAVGQQAIEALSADRVVVATSSSLLHSPVTLASETKLTPEQKDWFSFALEKAAEVATIAAVLTGSQDSEVTVALEANKTSIAKRRDFEKNSDDTIRKRVESITPDMFKRRSPFPVRREAQKKHISLPKFPSTTIGSFPVRLRASFFRWILFLPVLQQTKEIRTARAKLTKGQITEEEYEKFIEKEIQEVVIFQEKVGLDLFVHGEPERNDMVQYFGERLNGFVFTQNGWVQSYGSR